jgi:hypothetical protein
VSEFLETVRVLNARMSAVGASPGVSIPMEQAALCFTGLDVDQDEMQDFASYYANLILERVRIAARGSADDTARAVLGGVSGAVTMGVAIGLLLAERRRESTEAT